MFWTSQKIFDVLCDQIKSTTQRQSRVTRAQWNGPTLRLEQILHCVEQCSHALVEQSLVSSLPFQTLSAQMRNEAVDCSCTRVLIQALSISTSLDWEEIVHYKNKAQAICLLSTFFAASSHLQGFSPATCSLKSEEIKKKCCICMNWFVVRLCKPFLDYSVLCVLHIPKVTLTKALLRGDVWHRSLQSWMITGQKSRADRPPAKKERAERVLSGRKRKGSPCAD